MRRKNNYVMRRLDTPKRVTLPNGRTFYGKYQRVPRPQPPPIMKRRYRVRAAPRGRIRRPTRTTRKSTRKTNRKNCSKKSRRLRTSKQNSKKDFTIRRCYKLIK